jgi:hypothetical protein
MTLAEINAIRRKKFAQAIAKNDPSPVIQRQFGVIKDGKAVIATETPVMVYDEARRQWVAQVLLMN